MLDASHIVVAIPVLSLSSILPTQNRRSSPWTKNNPAYQQMQLKMLKYCKDELYCIRKLREPFLNVFISFPFIFSNDIWVLWLWLWWDIININVLNGKTCDNKKRNQDTWWRLSTHPEQVMDLAAIVICFSEKFTTRYK